MWKILQLAGVANGFSGAGRHIARVSGFATNPCSLGQFGPERRRVAQIGAVWDVNRTSMDRKFSKPRCSQLLDKLEAKERPQWTVTEGVAIVGDKASLSSDADSIHRALTIGLNRSSAMVPSGSKLVVPDNYGRSRSQ